MEWNRDILWKWWKHEGFLFLKLEVIVWCIKLLSIINFIIIQNIDSNEIINIPRKYIKIVIKKILINRNINDKK